MDFRLFAKAKHVGFIFDACFSGQALGLTRVSSVNIGKFITRRAFQVISAGAGDQTVADFKSMTTVMLDAIENKLCENNGLVTFNSLGLYLQQTMAADTSKTQIPQFGHLHGSQGGDFIFNASDYQNITGVSTPVLSVAAKPQILASAKPYHKPSSQNLTSHGIYQAQVDLSGRLEDASSPTVITISAGLSFSLWISGPEKQKTQQAIGRLRPRWGHTRINVLLYSTLIYLLIKDHIQKLDVVMIDPEYPGYESVIKERVLNLYNKGRRPIDKNKLRFERLAKNSPARTMASRVFKNISDPDWRVTAEDIDSLLDS